MGLTAVAVFFVSLIYTSTRYNIIYIYYSRKDPCADDAICWLEEFDSSHRFKEQGHESLSVLPRFLVPVLQKNESRKAHGENGYESVPLLRGKQVTRQKPFGHDE